MKVQVDEFEDVSVDDTFTQQIAEAAYQSAVEWFGAPQDAHWPCRIVQHTFTACAWSFLTRSYTISIDHQLTEADQIASALGHEMYHRVTGRCKTLRREVWIDELLAFCVQQRFLREQGFEASADGVEQQVRQSKVTVDFAQLCQSRAKRIRLGLGGIRYPPDFGFMVARLALALDWLLEWEDICLLASVPDLQTWYTQLDSSVAPVVIALMTSQDWEGPAEQERLDALMTKSPLSESLGAWLSLSYAYQLIGHLNAATVLLRRILAVHPEQPEALGGLANVLVKQGQLPQAIACYEQALLLTPEDAWIRENYGITLYQTGQKEQARKEWQYVVDNGAEDETRTCAALLTKFG